MKTAAILLLALAMAAVAALILADDTESDLEGVWTASRDAERLHLSIYREKQQWSQLGITLPLADFSGLSPAITDSSNIARTEFQIIREAGTIAFTGQFSKGRGAGHYLFVPRPEFIAEMAKLGYRDIPKKKIFILAVHDIGPRYVRALGELGYKNLSLEMLIKMGMFRVTPAFIRDLRSLGYNDLSSEQLVKLRIHNVTPEYIRQLRALGFSDLPMEQIAKLGIHGVTKTYVEEMRGLGFRNATASQLVANSAFSRINRADG